MTNIKNILNLNRLFLVTLLYFIINCNSEAELQNLILENESTKFLVSYKSSVTPLPLNSIHSWILHVKYPDGRPVEKANISVYGGMPAHKHGLPTTPQVTETGGGNYLVEGIKFSMTGKWVLWFKISNNDATDTIKIEVEL